MAALQVMVSASTFAVATRNDDRLLAFQPPFPHLQTTASQLMAASTKVHNDNPPFLQALAATLRSLSVTVSRRSCGDRKYAKCLEA